MRAECERGRAVQLDFMQLRIGGHSLGERDHESRNCLGAFERLLEAQSLAAAIAVEHYSLGQ